MSRQEVPIPPEDLTENQRLLCDKLIEVQAFKLGEFRIKLHKKYPEAPLSPVYIDLRMLQRFPAAVNIAIDTYVDLIKPLEYDLLAGIPTAATGVTTVLSRFVNKGMVTPRMDSKSHGTGAKIDGFLEEDRGKRVMVIDDLITHAESKLEAIAILEAEGFEVKDVAVLIDRQQGGREELGKKGYRLHSALTLEQMFGHYLNMGVLTPEDSQEARSRIKQLDDFVKQHEGNR